MPEEGEPDGTYEDGLLTGATGATGVRKAGAPQNRQASSLNMSEAISAAQSWVLVDEGAEPAQHEESVVGQSDPIVDPVEPEEQQNGHEGLVIDAPVVPAIKLDLAVHTAHESTDSHPVDAEHQEVAHSDSTEDSAAPHIWKQGATPRSLEASSSSTCTLADSAFPFFIVFNYTQKSPHF